MKKETKIGLLKDYLEIYMFRGSYIFLHPTTFHSLESIPVDLYR